MEDKIIEYALQIYTVYGYWCIAIVLATFAIMCVVNFALTKAFSKCQNTALVRLRKTLSSVLVFVVAGLSLTIANLILKYKLDFKFIALNSVPVAGLSMILWAVVKVVRDMGIKPILEAIANSKTARNILKQIPLDKKLVNAVFDNLVSHIESSNGDNAEIVAKKQAELKSMAQTLLNGFVETEKLSTISAQFVEALKLKFKNKEKE